MILNDHINKCMPVVSIIFSFNGNDILFLPLLVATIVATGVEDTRLSQHESL